MPIQRLNLAKNIMYACAVDPKSQPMCDGSHAGSGLGPRIFTATEDGFMSHFVDASEVLTQQENVTVHMALSKIDKR